MWDTMEWGSPLELKPKRNLIVCLLLASSTGLSSAQFLRSTAVVANDHVWSSAAGGPALTVQTRTPQPTMVYNCAVLKAICKNIDLSQGGTANAGTLSMELVHDHDNARKDARGTKMCPSNWRTSHTCPETNQPAIYNGGAFVQTGLEDPARPRTQADAYVLQSTNPNGRRSGMLYTCDEFPFRSTVQGGGGLTGDTSAGLTFGSTTYCAPQAWSCSSSAASQALMPPGQAVRTEQDCQSLLNSQMARQSKSSPSSAGQLWAYTFKTINNVDNDNCGYIDYIDSDGAGRIFSGNAKRSMYPARAYHVRHIVHFNGTQSQIVTPLTDYELQQHHRRRDLESIESLNITFTPVQKEYTVDNAPLPIIDISAEYIRGQLGANRSSEASNSTSVALNSTVLERALGGRHGGRHARHVGARKLPSGNGEDAAPGVTPWSPLHKRDGPIQCGPGQPCLDKSCCNTDGKCGFKSVHCGTNCISDCDAVAMCGIDSVGGTQKCGLNLCCSYYGWCGTEEIHCGTPEPNVTCQAGFGGCAVVADPVCSTTSGTTNGRKIGYYQSWNYRNRACNRVMPSQINTDGLTHLYYAFLGIDPVTYHVVPATPDDESLFYSFTALKSRGVQTWIAVGGFDFSDPGPTRTTWSDMASTTTGRAAFIGSLQTFMAKYGFQGVDIDWEYPATPERGGRAEDTENLVTLVREMRLAWGTTYGISSVLAPDYWYLRYFDAKGMEPYVDWFGFMAYDLHGPWDTDVNTLGSIVRPQTDIREIEKGLRPLWFAGINPAKVNFGLAYYGRGYTLSSSGCNTLGCAFSGASNPAPCTNFGGVMSNREIQALILEKSLVPTLLTAPMVKQITWDNQWIGYDDADTFALKLGFANSKCIGGTMIWSIDFDSGEGSGDDADLTEPRTDGRCGKDYGFAACDPVGPFGGCCGASGYCGAETEFCLVSNGCQNGCSGSGVIYIDPSIWGSPTPTVTCQPPCTFVLPPSTLPAPTTVTPVPITTSLRQTKTTSTSLIEGSSTRTASQVIVTYSTTTIVLPPITLTAITWSPVVVTKSTSSKYSVSNSIQPPYVTVTWPRDTGGGGGVTNTRPVPPPPHTVPLPKSVSVNIGPPGPTCVVNCGCLHCPPGGGGGSGGGTDPPDPPDPDEVEEEDDENSCKFADPGQGDPGGGSSGGGNSGSGAGAIPSGPTTITRPNGPVATGVYCRSLDRAGHTFLMTSTAACGPATPAPSTLAPPPPPPPTPSPPPPPAPPAPRRETEEVTCFNQGTVFSRRRMVQAIDYFCRGGKDGKFGGLAVDGMLRNNGFIGVEYWEDKNSLARVSVMGLNGCAFHIADECARILRRPTDECDTDTADFKHGGYLKGNCAQWTVDPTGTIFVEGIPYTLTNPCFRTGRQPPYDECNTWTGKQWP